ncbi:MAG: hypothetical protein ACKVX7_08990 [Planctomycetota bacterium]
MWRTLLVVTFCVGASLARLEAQVAGDACVDAVGLGGVGTVSFSTVGATTDGFPVAGCGGASQISNDIWYCFTPLGPGVVEIELENQTFPAAVAVYSMCLCPASPSQLLGCDSGSVPTVIFPVAMGNSFLIRVGGAAAGASGTGDLTLNNHMRRGDCNDDGLLNIADAIYTLTYLFPPPTGGTVDPPCKDDCDSNDDAAVDVADAVQLLSTLFSSAGPLPAPFPNCGRDPTPDLLDCPRKESCP